MSIYIILSNNFNSRISFKINYQSPAIMYNIHVSNDNNVCITYLQSTVYNQQFE